MAGRSAEKLAAIRAGLPAAAAQWPLIVADASDPDALARMATSTRVVASTVGPYAKYGVPLVAACASVGTHYADLTGEVLFVRQCADDFDATARASGAKIVNACGFDSIPSDIGVFETHRAAVAAGAGGLRNTTFVLTGARGGFSGGTIDSLRNQVDVAAVDPTVGKVLADPFALSPDRAAEPQPGRGQADNDSLRVGRDASSGVWTGPFVMAPFNTRIVRRSNALLDWAYGKDFHYREVVGFGSTPVGPFLAGGMALGMAGLMAGMRFGPARTLLDRFLPEPGAGPSEEARRNGYFAVEIHAETDAGSRVRTTVAAQGDPGYAATSVMLGESALCLALDGDLLPDRSGVLTPAVAMGSRLADRLRAAGFTIDARVQG